MLHDEFERFAQAVRVITVRELRPNLPERMLIHPVFANKAPVASVRGRPYLQPI
jgi:hypothetical protein